MKPFLLAISLFLSVAAHAQTKITVRVLDDKNAPVAGAHIEAQMWRDRSKPIAPQTTGADGAAILEIPVLEGGKTVGGGISVVAPGFAFTNALLTGKDLEVRLEPGVTWRGKVSDEAGKPLAGASVSVSGAILDNDYQNQKRPFGEKNIAAYIVKSGADGSFAIAGVPAKMKLQIGVEHPNYVVKNEGQILPDAEASFKLVLGGALKGRILDMAGQPLAGVVVYASLPRYGGGNQGKTDETGHFSIGSLAAGIHNLTAYWAFEGKAPEFVLPRATGIAVEVGKTTEVPELRAVKGVTIEALVRDAATKLPLEGASVIAQAGNETDGYATTDKAGKASLRILPGKYKVYLAGPPEGYIRPEEQQNAVAGEMAIAPLVFDLKKATILRGNIVDEAGAPLQAKLKIDYNSSIESDAKGEWKYAPPNSRRVHLAGGDAQDGYFEVVSPKYIEAGTQTPTTITLRKKPWQTVPGRAVTTDGKPLEGVQIEASFYTPTGDDGSLSSSARTAKSDANGAFTVPQVREGLATGYFNIKGEKEGYAFQKGGEVSKNGAALAVTDLIFVPLNFKIAGKTAPGARVTAAGKEVVAGADGSFQFDGLPETQDKVWAFKGADFGGASPKAPLRIELAAQTAQPRDPDLARDVWNDIVTESQRGTKGRTYYSLPTVERFIAAAANETPDFAAHLQKATGDSQIAAAGGRVAGKVDGAALETAFARIKDAETRAYAYLNTAAKWEDKTFAARALQEAEATFKTADKEGWMRETNLYRAASLAAKTGGDAAGFAALDRAVAHSLKNHGPKSTRVGGRHTAGRDEAMANQAALVARGGLLMVRRLLENIDPGLGYEVMALSAAIPALAQSGGAEAVLPLLDELEKMPEPPQTEDTRRADMSPQYAFADVASKIVPLLGAKSPQKALELARRVSDEIYGNRQKWEALAGAAKFQTPEVAAPLWREIVSGADAQNGPRYAARAWELDPKLGRELFAIARQKVETEGVQEWQGRAIRGGFGFYFARADAAQARFLLEREWGAARQKKTESSQLGALALAMAALDGPRAWQMAREIPNEDDFASFDARRRIGLFLAASDEKRRDFPFSQQDYEEWRALEEE